MRKFPEARESWIDQVVIAFRLCLIGQENSTSQFSRPITEKVKDNHFNPGVLVILENFLLFLLQDHKTAYLTAPRAWPAMTRTTS